jgi:hypothetical protein
MISVNLFLFNFFKRGTVNIELIIWPHQQCLTASCINFHTTGQFHYKFGFEKKFCFQLLGCLTPLHCFATDLWRQTVKLLTEWGGRRLERNISNLHILKRSDYFILVCSVHLGREDDIKWIRQSVFVSSYLCRFLGIKG